MLAKDLKCPTCGSPPRDVAPEFEIQMRSAISWTCQNGHRHISGWRHSERYSNAWTLTHLALKE